MSRDLSSDERKCPNLKCQAPYAATANYCYDCGEALSEEEREKQKKQREQEKELNTATAEINKLEGKIDDLRKKNGNLEGRIGDLRKTNRNLERKIGDLEKQDRDLDKSNKTNEPTPIEEQNNIPVWYYWSFLGVAVVFLILLIIWREG